MDIRVAGENALIVHLGRDISPHTLDRVRRLASALERHHRRDLIDLIPSYGSLVVVFDSGRVSHRKLRDAILAMPLDDATAAASSRLVELPVYYSTEAGPDLDDLARRLMLTTDEVIRLHATPDYRVYAIGFAPGFAYLGELDPRLAVPRLATPRPRVPRGAVAIAGRQTAVYPAPSPGGWHLIGRCPTTLFDPDASPPMPVQVGDRVRFVPVNRAEFLRLGGEL